MPLAMDPTKSALLALLCAALPATGQRPPPFTLPSKPPEELQADGEWWFYKLLDMEFPHTVVEPLDRGSVAPAGADASDGLILDLPDADYVVLEFFAPWCPHCKHYAPELAKVVEALEGEMPGRVKVLSVDCERIDFRGLCEWADANMMPRLVVAKRDDWLGELGETADSSDGVYTKFPVETAQETMDWLAEVVEEWPNDPPEVEPEDEEAPFFGWSQPPEGVEEPRRAPAQDLAVAVVSLLHEAFSSLDFQPDTKEALLDLLGLLCAAGPGGSTCRDSACSMRQDLETNWDAYAKEKLVTTNEQGEDIEPFTSHYLDWPRVEMQHRWCGRPWPEYANLGWSWCRGRFTGTRGYTCGLWLLFHSLLANAAESPELDGLAARRLSELKKPPLEVVRGTVRNFFGCQECRDHFLAAPVTDADLSSGANQEVWLWKVHNEATARIAEEEQRHSSSAPPRQQWPTQFVCPTCYGADGNWNVDEVAKQLLQFYGSGGSGSSPSLRALADDDDKDKELVDVKVFYFTLCPHCQDFLRSGLLPLVEAGLAGVQLTVLPLYPPMLPLASSGLADCKADDACALALAPLCVLASDLQQPAPATDPRFLRGVRFAACDMDSTATGGGRSGASLEECARAANVSWQGRGGMRACAAGAGAFGLLTERCADLEKAMYHLHDDVGLAGPPSMPWLLVDGDLYYWEGGVCLSRTGASGKEVSLDPPITLLQLICSKLHPQPAACADATPAPPRPAESDSVRDPNECENCEELIPGPPVGGRARSRLPSTMAGASAAAGLALLAFAVVRWQRGCRARGDASTRQEPFAAE